MSRSDRWVNSAPEETGVDVDSDYIGKMDAEHERADDCLADDPDAGEAQFDRSADGNSGMDDRKMDEHTFEAAYPDGSKARTSWMGDHKDAFEKGGRKWEIQMGLPVDEETSHSHPINTYERDTHQYLTEFQRSLFPEKDESEIKEIIQLVRDDPGFGGRGGPWNPKGGFKAAVPAYAVHIADWENPIETIDERIGIETVFDSKSDLLKAIDFAEKQIEKRGIDTSNY
ncbi:hypothetical protein [Halorhabdus sp. CBA1104]|uniref:hypothetical protein n=1 Tax=Halorhabdus sp. CBA1104 TaxID=1380432 RepID=UPI0012B1EE6D|nr:hypothetical protein [Halorhabdus sp. CBA1104]